jgi:hypothetical protein
MYIIQTFACIFIQDFISLILLCTTLPYDISSRFAAPMVTDYVNRYIHFHLLTEELVNWIQKKLQVFLAEPSK